MIPSLDIAGKVPTDTSILILNRKNDSQTPIRQSLLLQQELTEVRHLDHILITYPDLGHLFYPSSQWLTAVGPIEPKVLEDLFGMFEYLLMQVFDIKEAAVFIPLGFGLLVGLVYAIISSIRRKD